MCGNGSIDDVIDGVVMGCNEVMGVNKIAQTLLLSLLLLLMMTANNSADTFGTTNHSSPALCRRAVRLALRHVTSTALHPHLLLVPDVASIIIMSAMPHINHTQVNHISLTICSV